jgi:D-sedoheptulose 7-phosphate isomerase
MNTVAPAFLRRPAPPLTDTYRNDLQEHLELFLMLSALKPAVQAAALRWSDCLALGGKLMFCGNGGSAADCQHLAAELTGRLLQERRPLAAMALTTDSSALTCIGNDYHFDQVFARQVKALGQAGDCLVAISTSGQSPNVLQAAQAARERGVHTLALTGRDGGELATLCDQAIVVPSFVTARIQEAHIFIGHSLCALAEQQLAARGLL